jgi:trehalose/maltose transport system substrate-binding protein
LERPPGELAQGVKMATGGRKQEIGGTLMPFPILLLVLLFVPGLVRSQTVTFTGETDQVESGRWTKSKVEQWSRETGIPVRYITRPASATETLSLWQQDWAAHTPDIDIYLIDVIWPAIAAPHASDLRPYFSSKELGEFFPRIVENSTVNGKLVAIPFFMDAGLLYYRTDLLEKYGLDLPETWTELTRMAKIIQDGERDAGDKDFYGFLFQGAAYEGLTCNVLEWLTGNGAGHIVESDGTVSINNPRSKAALTLAKSWVDTISPKEVTTYQEEESRIAWQEGHAAFLRNWPYIYALSNAETSAIKGRFGVTYLPRGDGPNASAAATLGGWQLMLSAYSKNKDAAAKLIKFMVSYDRQKEYAIKLSRLPTLPALYEDVDVLTAQPWFWRLFRVFQDAVARPSTATGANYDRVSTDVFQITNQVF